MKPLLRTTLLTGLLLAAGAGLTRAQERQPILPGFWESTIAGQMGPIRDSDTTRRCIRPSEIERFFSGPSNRHYTCTYPTRDVAGGRARFQGTCRDKRGRTVQVSVAGTYTDTSFNLAGNISTRIGGVPLNPRVTMQARRLSATCPG